MILHRIETHARTRPQHPALRFGGQAFSYADLHDAIGQTAQRLQQLGVTRTTPVGVYADNHSTILLLYYAVAQLGGTFVPINAVLGSAEVRYIVRHAGLDVVFTDTTHLAQARAAVNDSDCRVLDMASLFDDAAGHTGPCTDIQDAQPNPDFLIIYTSGSTGVPKAVTHTQAGEQAANQSLIDMWGMQTQDKLLVALPLGFAYGLSTGAAMGLQAGCEVILLPRFHPKDVLHAMTTHGISVFQGVPTMYAMLLEYAEQHALDVDLSAVRLLIVSGAPLAADLRQRFVRRFHKTLENYYALTEARPVFGCYARDTAPVPEGAIGKTAPGVRVRLVVDGRDVEQDGQVGELWVQAPATTHGYFKAPDISATALVQGWFRTGDLSYRDPHGFYYLSGRIKDIIICGGANIAPAEVENVLHRHAAVHMAAVIGVPDPKFGEVPLAFLVLAADKHCNDAEMAAHCQQSLAEFKVPRIFVRLSHMPLGITGKIDKKALLAHWQQMHAPTPDTGVIA